MIGGGGRDRHIESARGAATRASRRFLFSPRRAAAPSRASQSDGRACSADALPEGREVAAASRRDAARRFALYWEPISAPGMAARGVVARVIAAALDSLADAEIFPSRVTRAATRCSTHLFIFL